MALEGTIKEFGLPDIFQLIGLQKKTGVLFLKGADCTVNVHFEDGSVVKVEESQRRPKYLIGNIIQSRGNISRDQVMEAVEIQKSTMQKLGSVFISQGLITKEDLRDALAFQMREAVYKVFRWKGGDYKFYQDKVDYDRDTIAPISAEHILMDGIRMLDEWPRIEKKIPYFEIVLEKTPGASLEASEDDGKDIFSGFTEKAARGSLSKDATKVFAFVDGIKTVYEIVEFCSLGEFDTCKALSELMDQGYLVKTISKSETMFEREPALEKEARKEPSKFFDYLPYAAMILAFIIFMFQITGTRKIMNPKHTELEDLKMDFAVGQVEHVEDNALLFYFDYGVPLANLNDLAKYDYIQHSDLSDPWGSNFLLDVSNGLPVEVVSPGPDKTPGTADDISL